jgi:hypothetical protein
MVHPEVRGEAVVPLDDLEEVVVEAWGGAVDVVVEVVMGVRRYQQTIWMLIWRSTMQKLCKQIDGNEYTVIFICLDLAIGFVTFVLYDFSTLKK